MDIHLEEARNQCNFFEGYAKVYPKLFKITFHRLDVGRSFFGYRYESIGSISLADSLSASGYFLLLPRMSRVL